MNSNKEEEIFMGISSLSKEMELYLGGKWDRTHQKCENTDTGHPAP
jgi:hypothetical protein